MKTMLHRTGVVASATPFQMSDYKVVATRGNVQFSTTAISAPNNTIEGRSRQRITAAGLTDVRMLFSNWYPNAVSPYVDILHGNDIPVTAALEWDTPAAYAKAKYGGTDIVVPSNADYLVTDDINAGSLGLTNFTQFGVYWERTSSTLASGTWLQGQKASRVTGEFAFRHNPPAQQALGTGAMTQYGGSGQRAYLPTTVIGRVKDPSYKVMLGVGDSRMQGSNDSDDTTEGAFGFVQKACMWDGTKAIASLNIGRGGDSVMDFLVPEQRRMHLVPLATHAVVWYGFNDRAHYSRTDAQVLADLETLADSLRAAGIQKVAMTNQPPYTTGTFTTTGGQSAASPSWEGFRQALNAGIAASSHFDAVLDASTILQDSGDNTKWKANYTVDGIHPAAVGHTDITAALKTIMASWGF